MKTTSISFLLCLLLAAFHGVSMAQLKPTITLSSEKASYAVGEPVSIRALVSNPTRVAVTLPLSLDPSFRLYNYTITNPLGKSTVFRAFMYVEPEEPYVTLAGGGRMESAVYLYYGSTGPSFPTAGTYTVRCSYQALQSNVLTITIRKPANAAEETASTLMLEREVGLFLYAGGGHTLTKAVTNLERVEKEFGQTAYGDYARVGLGVYHSFPERDFRANKVIAAQPELAKRLLEPVLAKPVVGAYFEVKAYNALVEDYLLLNDKAGARVKLEDFRKNLEGLENAKPLIRNIEPRIR